MGIEKFSPSQIEAIELLAIGKSPAEIAKKLKLSVHAIYKWQQNQDFNLEIKKLVLISYDSAMQEMSLMGVDAVAELRKIINSEDTRTRDKLDAIKLLFGIGEKARAWTKEECLRQKSKGTLNY
jgi:transposase-like protein